MAEQTSTEAIISETVCITKHDTTSQHQLHPAMPDNLIQYRVKINSESEMAQYIVLPIGLVCDDDDRSPQSSRC